MGIFDRLFAKNKSNQFVCTQCGEIHEEWPALGFLHPIHYGGLSENEQETQASLSSDFCVIEYEGEGEVYRFIRVTLHQQVIDYHVPLDYGVWVSLSEKSFTDYETNFDNENHITEYFGWLCNEIAPYDSTLSIPVTVCTRSGNERPEIVPHRSHEHLFVKDYYQGISRKEAERRIHSMMEG